VDGVRNPACLLLLKSSNQRLILPYIICRLKLILTPFATRYTPEDEKDPNLPVLPRLFVVPSIFLLLSTFHSFLAFAVSCRYSSGNLKQEELPEKPILDVTLEPGDVLYVPCVIRSKLYFGWQCLNQCTFCMLISM
jgi:hypothetical protein